MQRLDEEVNVADVNGQDAYRRAVALVRWRGGMSSRNLQNPPADLLATSAHSDVELARRPGSEDGSAKAA